jgi:hypothetical protein
MRKMIMGVLVMAVMVGGVWGQTYWKKTYGRANWDEAKSITPTTDGNFVVVGGTYNLAGTGEDAYLLKIKPNGDTIWTKTYGRANEDWVSASAIVPTPEGNFLVVGNIYIVGTATNAIYLLKINPNGDTLWTKMYGRAYWDEASAIAPTSDGNFIVAGFRAYNSNTLQSDVILLKLKPDGDTIWTKTYVGDYCNRAYAIIPTQDGNFLVAGSSAPPAAFNDVYLLKIKPNGDTLWTKTYGGTSEDLAFSIVLVPDGNFIVAGYTSSYGAGNWEVYLLKITPYGDTLWTKTYGGTNDEFVSAITTAGDGNFIVAGWHTLPAVAEGVLLLKVRPNGDTVWTKTDATYRGNRIYAISPVPDGNFIAVGLCGTGSGNGIYLMSLIDDRYAYKNSPFTFKIPVSGDSINHGYAALKVPAGMTVSMGGTISWTPTTDSSYMDHVEFLVSDDMGKKDTLTFNIFVNSKAHPTKAINTVSRQTSATLNDLTINQLSSKEVRFSLPAGTKSLGIYNIHGQLLANISVRGNQATWLPKRAAGRYFAKAIWEKRETVKPFMLVK